MEIIDYTLRDAKVLYAFPESFKYDLSDILFLDIETTGFTAKNSKLYLIGCVYYADGCWRAIQFFAEKYSDEEELLREFFKFAYGYKLLIHFNGNNFDIPYLKDKCSEFSLPFSFDNFDGIDIYRRVAPLKDFLKLENCKQKTIEAFLNIERDDKMSGGDLIGVYHSYISTQSDEDKQLLLLHNFDDIKGMLDILPILAYSDLFNEKITVTKVSANYFTDENGQQNAELLMVATLPSALNIPVSNMANRCYFTGGGDQAMIKVPLFEGELKYFYANHSDYYYLPDEDIALHKSVASFVDKNHREQAKASTCYTKKASRFLPEWDALFTPFFKKSYEDKQLYFELTKERQTDRALFNSYASHILNTMI